MLDSVMTTEAGQNRNPAVNETEIGKVAGPEHASSKLRRILRGDNEEEKIRKVLKPVDRNVRVLDVGCGLGEKYRFLETLGFNSIVGVEKNPRLVEINVREGRDVVTPDTFFEQRQGNRYGLVLMSHVIEHLEWEDLLSFMESYLDVLERDGYLLVVSPVLHVRFYNDFDHVKPYLPDSIRHIFGNMEQVQVKPRHRLELLDIRFRRASLSMPYFRSLYVTNWNKLPRIANILLALIFTASFRTLGRTTGWIGLFQKRESA